MTRKLEIEKFWENYIVPDISLRETAAIYDLTMHAQLIGKHISPATFESRSGVSFLAGGVRSALRSPKISGSGSSALLLVPGGDALCPVELGSL